MIIIQVAQGYYRGLTGTPRPEVLTMFARNDAEFLAAYPDCAKHHRPCWRELEVPDDQRAPWGHEWWVVDEAGLLKLHSAQYDSSG